MYDLIKGGVLDAELIAADMGGSAIQGAWRSMQNVRRRHIFLAMEAGLLAETPTIALQQAINADGDSPKTLQLTKLYVKIGSGDWVEKTAISRQAPVDNYDTSADGDGTNVLQVCAVVDGETLDDGYTHVRINTAAVTGDRKGVVVHAVTERSYQGEVDGGE